MLRTTEKDTDRTLRGLGSVYGRLSAWPRPTLLRGTDAHKVAADAW